MDTRFAISEYPDAVAINKQLDELKWAPIYSIKRDKLAEYEAEYYGKKCAKSKEMIDIAKERIPGGVQHNLAFNYPHPLVSPRQRAQSCMTLTAMNIMTFFRPAVQPSLVPMTLL